MKKQNEKNELFEWLKIIVFTLALVVGVRYFLFMPIDVSGASMMPTLEDGDKMFVNKITPKFTDYDRFDVVIFKVTEEKDFVKRIIGLPGDQIAYQEDVLYINGEVYDEPYLDELKAALHGMDKLTGTFTLEGLLNESVVPEGYYFVLGDNRQFSRDSRDVHAVGFVSEEQIIGKVEFVFYPLNHFGGVTE